MLADLCWARECRLVGSQRALVVDPAVSLALKCDEMLHRLQLRTDTVHRGQVVAVRANNLRPRVVDDICEVIGRQTVIDRDQDRTQLRNGVERLELGQDVGGDVGHPVAGADAQPLQGGRPAVTAVEELRVGQPAIAVDNRLAIRVHPAGPAHELQGRERSLHPAASLPPPPTLPLRGGGTEKDPRAQARDGWVAAPAGAGPGCSSYSTEMSCFDRSLTIAVAMNEITAVTRM